MRGESRAGKTKNRDNGIAQGAEQIDRDCFKIVCLLPAPIVEAELERRFRMPRCVYMVLRESVLETDRYFLQKRDTLGKLGASTDQKMVCASHQLAYGVPAERFRCSRSPSTGESGQCRALRRTGHYELFRGTHQLGAASRTSAILSSVHESVFIWHRINHLANRISPILGQKSARSIWVGYTRTLED
jgi:hypothetical protein